MGPNIEPQNTTILSMGTLKMAPPIRILECDQQALHRVPPPTLRKCSTQTMECSVPGQSPSANRQTTGVGKSRKYVWTTMRNNKILKYLVPNPYPQEAILLIDLPATLKNLKHCPLQKPQRPSVTVGNK